MQQEVNFAQLFASHLHEFSDLFVALNVQRLKKRSLTRVGLNAVRDTAAVLLLVVVCLVWQM